MIGLVFSLWMTKYLPGFVPVYGQILYWYKALIAVTMTLLVVRQFLKRKSGQILLLLTGLLVYSLSLIFHALCLGHFEPAYTGWFEEWGTFILVMCFAVPMALRNMLDSEITIEKMKSGLSKIRNRGIAAAFSYMNIVEAWGSGIPKMFREAKEYGLREPELIDMGSDFRINLYRKKAAIDQNGVIDPKERDTNDTKVEPNDTNEEAILSIILKNPQATQGTIAKEVEASLSTVKRIMRSLQKSGKLRREGTNRNGSWVVTGQKE